MLKINVLKNVPISEKYFDDDDYSKPAIFYKFFTVKYQL